MKSDPICYAAIFVLTNVWTARMSRHRGIPLREVLKSDCCAPSCDRTAEEDAPFPLCGRHLRMVFEYFDGFAELAKQIVKERYPIGSEQLQDLRTAYDLRKDAKRQPRLEHEQVYYLRAGQSIKIGYSANILQRLRQMRLDREHVLATEPGGRDLERMRHLQFAHLRHGRREDFDPADDLLSHIEMIREHFGPPRITTHGGRVA